MIICVVKDTNRILEMQSDAKEGTLLKNAISQGYKETDIIEKEVTIAEYKEAIKIDPVTIAITAATAAEVARKEEEKLDASTNLSKVRDIEEMKVFIEKYILPKVY